MLIMFSSCKADVKGKANMKGNEAWADRKQVKICFYQEQTCLIRSHIKWSFKPTDNIMASNNWHKSPDIIETEESIRVASTAI